jgi:hypothetical protein
VSLVENLESYMPVIETPEHIEGTGKAFVGEERNGTMLVKARFASVGRPGRREE